MKYDVFISYSRKDSAIVKKFADELSNAGYSVWMDVDGIETGDEFKRKIVSAIENSEIFLFFSSSSSNISQWTVKEVNVAVELKKNIIPIKLDNADYNESVDFDLCAVDFIQCADVKVVRDAVGKLLRSLRSRIGAGSYKKVVEDKEDVVKEPKKKIVGGNNGNGDRSSSNFWDFFASSTFKVSFRYLVVLLIVVSVGTGILYLNMPDDYVRFCTGRIEDMSEGLYASQNNNSKYLCYLPNDADGMSDTLYNENCGLLCLVAVDKSNRQIAYFTAEEWDSVDMKSEYAKVGVLIKDDNHEFIIAPTDCKDPDDGDYELQFGCYDVEFDGVRQYKDISGFFTTGYNDTKKIVEQSKGKTDSEGIEGAPAAEAAWNYKANEYDNLQWYLPSVSELIVIYRNRDAINNFIDNYIPQGERMYYKGWYWSSTLPDYGSSWVVEMHHGHNYPHYYDRYSGLRVRAVSFAK